MGSLGGSGMALVALWLWQRYARNPDGTPFFPVEIEPGLFLAAMLLATLTGLAAAFAPALRAARLDPVVAIRG
jgi:lipoprotein-releasing system permease protein